MKAKLGQNMTKAPATIPEGKAHQARSCVWGIQVILSHAFLPGIQRAPVTASASTAHIFLLSLTPSGFLQPLFLTTTYAFVTSYITSELVKLLIAPRVSLNYLLLSPTIPQTHTTPPKAILISL